MKKFELESQFATPEEYYKAQLVLRKVNEETGLSDLKNKIWNFQELVTFCNQNKLTILGVNVTKKKDNRPLELIFSTSNIEYISGYSGNNDWILNDEKVKQ